MGRTKPVAKRRRVDEEEAEQKAIETLLNIPQDQVEAAAALATRESCEHWPKVENDDQVPDWLSGLGIATTLPSQHFEALKSLHEMVKQQAANKWTSWSGSKEDPRKRAFGFLPDTLGYNPEIRDLLDISTPWKEDDDDQGEEERQRNNKAMVVLEKLPDGTREAIDFLCDEFLKKISSMPKNNKHCRTYLRYSNLIAAQPNLHCGRELLPTHVDHPKKDGFGVIIVTISIVGSGTILLQDFFDQNKKRTMEVLQGQAYMLSANSRDACAHGVVALDGQRESLNLRFGLHDLSRGDEHPIVSSSDFLQYWETDAEKKYSGTS